MSAFGLAALAAAAIGCGADEGKKPITAGEIAVLRDRTLASIDDKADGDAMLVGELVYGQTSSLVTYYAPPDYRLFAFTASTGDEVEVRVSSTNGGDAIAWVVDADFEVLAMNDDASSATFDARVSLVIPPHADSRHYVVFRDYGYDWAKFRVALDGTAPGCQHDTDCEIVEAGCCAVGDFIALPGDEVAAFEESKDCDKDASCPLVPIQDRGAQALCDVGTGACELVLPDDVACGGHSSNAHACPDGWSCRGDALAWDGLGECLQICAGPGARPCPAGRACVGDVCR
jgi:hypothetical protein